MARRKEGEVAATALLSQYARGVGAPLSHPLAEQIEQSNGGRGSCGYVQNMYTVVQPSAKYTDRIRCCCARGGFWRDLDAKPGS